MVDEFARPSPSSSPPGSSSTQRNGDKKAQKAPGAGGRTCDNCRKRKIKCIEDPHDADGQPCDGCRKLGLECKHDYIKKKPGRKNSFALHAMKARQSAEREGSGLRVHTNGFGNGNGHGHGQGGHGAGPPPLPSPNGHGGGPGPGPGVHRHPPSFQQHSFSPYPSYQPLPFDPSMRASSSSSSSFQPPALPTSTQPPQHHPAPASTQHIPPSLMFTSTSDPSPSAPEYPTPSGSSVMPVASASTPGGRPMSSFAFSPSAFKTPGGDLSWLDSIFEGNGTNFAGTADFLGDSSSLFTTQFPSEQAHLLSLESPEHMLATGHGGVSIGGPGSMLPPMRREPQLEDVTSWANISHYISLFLQYLYPLLPLVHRPTFAEHLATRRDLRDTDFRALLLSIVTYVISQLPTSRLVNDQFDIEGLKHLQRRCHRTCKVLQRTYYGPTNLTQVTTIVFDTFYLLSIGLGHTAAARLGQACQLAFSMGMHSDAKTDSIGLDAIEIQLRRRVFWQLYVSDKTRAIPGPPMLINDFQGVCSLPEPVDDEFITSQGMFPQPSSRTSVLAGFVAIAREFQIISECFFHHRYILNTGSKTISTDWTVEAEDRLHRILRDLPQAIQDPMTNQTEAAKQSFAMQRANILITAAIAKFALYDLRSALDVDEESLGREREAIAREIHGLLMNIPVEDLASNGESVRGKVFHIACALCVQAPNAADTDLVRDWCNMFSTISFLQMPPPPPEAAVDSRAGTPPGPEGGTASSLTMSAPTNRST